LFIRSYIKIIGPPIIEALKELEKIAIDMPEVCIMDNIIRRDLAPIIAGDLGGQKIKTHDFTVSGFFMERTGVVVPVKRCFNIISDHGMKLGEYDFFFEWRKEPTSAQVNNLISKIDEAFKKIGCHYTITTK
jgi:hypothetical protein